MNTRSSVAPYANLMSPTAPTEASTEIELTLLAERADLLAWLRQVPDSWSSQGQQRLVSEYWDSADAALLQRGLVLRLRRIGRRYWQNLKSSQASHAGLAIRQEWQWPLPRKALNLAALHACPAMGATPLPAELQLQFSTDIERSCFTTQFAHSVIQLAVDVGHIECREQRLPVAEIELELLQGRLEDLYQVALALCQQLPLQLASCSKGERGWRLALSQSPPPSRHIPQVHAGQGVAATVTLLAHAALQQFLLNRDGFLNQPDENEYLHQLRVAARRLRAVCGGFKPWLTGSAELRKLLRQWQDLMQVLGQARDLDVLIEDTLPHILQGLDPKPYQDWLAQLRAEQQQTRVLAQQQLRQCTPLLLATLLYLATLDDDATALAQAGRRLLQRRWRSLRRCVVAGADLHQVRIEAKKARYPAEWLAQVYPRNAQPTLDYLSEVQSRLGDWHDALSLQQRISAAPLTVAAACDLLQRLDSKEPALPHKPPRPRFWR